MDQKYIVALEFAGSQVRGALATVPQNTDGSILQPTIEAIVSEDNCDCVQYGRVQNLVNAQKYVNNVVRRLTNEITNGKAHIIDCYAALAGRSLGSEKTTAEIQLATEMEITPDIVKKLFVEASRNATVNKKVLKVLPRRFYVDNSPMPDPVGTLGRRLRGDFTLVTCNPANQRNLEMVLRDKVGMHVADYVITPLALADMVLVEEEKQLGCVLVDIGVHTTTVAIYKDRCLQYLATLPMGGGNITNDIVMGLNSTLEKAELMKCAQGNALPDNTRSGDESAAMNRYVAARAYEIVANIVACIGYADYRSADLAGGIVLCGGTAKLKNIDRLIENRSKMRVRHATLPNNIRLALNTNNIRPQDYLSIIAIIDKVARQKEIADCVSFGNVAPKVEPKKAEVKTESKVNNNPVTSNFTPIDISSNDESDETVLDDDPGVKTEEKATTKNEKTKKTPKENNKTLGWLKEKFITLMNDSSMDNDTPI